MPWEALTRRSSAKSEREIAPAFACGSSPLSASTSSHIAARYSTVEP